ncbi:MAG: hypothetical protein H0U10_01795 [Chloroflexia bacterium]|nr:hypothetical protein [Chloroflexia bacterium]
MSSTSRSLPTLAARSPHEAIQDFLDPLNLIVSCISLTPIQKTAEGSRFDGHMSFPNNAVVPLRGRHRLALKVFHAYEATEDASGWSAHTRAYLYHVYADDGREFTVFHWHPERGRVALPHAHFKTLNDPIPMGKAHIPTGRVSLEAVVRLLIDELAVQPIRQDWERVLSRTERAFIERRSWHGQPPLPGAPLETQRRLG